ncbi:MAG: OmpA family protein [Mitsuaria chitosanitabida]|uniref:OmpA family protein n=1 Tax=Roseateles chitosanitabidus TaxID=65048 RepID=UPI001B019B3A|nr:OmpA family protein [Roseateles chitosanitabidus]MBO9687529.1 OmpA family protein [Roseateles chitosanitabidus]
MKFPRTPARPPRRAIALDAPETSRSASPDAPATHAHDAPRRRLLSGLAVGAAGVWLGALAGCQTAAPAPEASPGTLTDPQRQALRKLGFQHTDAGWELNLSMSLLFDFDSVLLHAPQRAELQRMGQNLAEIGITGLRVEGHTDSIGRADYNQKLSLRRAEAVAQALQTSGLAFKELQVRGFGMERPIADNGTESGRAQNRRVALIVAG